MWQAIILGVDMVIWVFCGDAWALCAYDTLWVVLVIKRVETKKGYWWGRKRQG